MRKDEHEQTEILYREPKFYPSHNINLRVISEKTPAALSRTPKGRPQTGSRHSCTGKYLNASPPQSKREAAPSKTPSVKPKNFPTEPRRKRKANQKFAPVMAGFCGEVLGVRGRLGGREGTLSRVPSLPPRSFSPRSLPQNQICSLTLEALPTLPRR